MTISKNKTTNIRFDLEKAIDSKKPNEIYYIDDALETINCTVQSSSRVNLLTVTVINNNQLALKAADATGTAVIKITGYKANTKNTIYLENSLTLNITVK